MRFYQSIMVALGAAAALLIGAVALGMSLDVIQRNLGLGTLSWMLESCEYAIFLATFLGAPWVLHQGSHVRVDVLVQSLPRSVARVLEIGGDAVGLATSGVLFYFAVAVARGSIRDGARIIKMFIIPEWWVFGVIAFATLLLIVEFARRIALALVAAPIPPTSSAAH